MKHRQEAVRGVRAGIGHPAVVLLVVTASRGCASGRRAGRFKAALDNLRTIGDVRLQIMLNRLYLNNFLLSGDPRDEENVNKGTGRHCRRHQTRRSADFPDLLRTALIQVESTETSWVGQFRQAHAGQASPGRFGRLPPSPTCRFSIYKRIPASWLAKSSAVLDRPRRISRRSSTKPQFGGQDQQVERRHQPRLDVAAIAIGAVVAYFTAKSITQPLTHLITVAREIGDSG